MSLGHDEFANEYNPALGPHNLQRDKKIKEAIIIKLNGHTEIDSSDVRIDVSAGLVTLSGKINSSDAKQTVGAIVSNIDGVIDVVNFIEIYEAIDSGSGDGLHNMI